MQTIKTGVVVALLLAVCYGAFVALNAPEPELPEELKRWAQQSEGMDGFEMPEGDQLVSLEGATVSNDPFADLNFGASSSTPPMAAVDSNGSTDNSVPALDPIPSLNTDSKLPSSGNLDAAATALTAAANSNDVPVFPALPASPSAAGTESQPSSTPAAPTDTGLLAADGPAVALPLAAEPPSLNVGSRSPQAQVASAVTPLPDEDKGNSWQLPLLQGESTTSMASSTERASAAAPAGSDSQLLIQPFVVARKEALEKAQRGELSEALKQLSPYYDSPELTHVEHSDLVDILDALSREVIYSKRHLLQSAHVTVASDTVASVAEQYKISTELLAKINNLGSSSALTPQTRLKVVQGPFRATVSLTRGELTLFLGKLYAGRFPISIGKDPVPVEGTYEVIDRRTDRTYYGTGGRIIPATDSRNPYGGIWINLGQDLCIHGTPETTSRDLIDAGCISLAPLDAADVYDILGKSSEVKIMR